VPTSHSWLVTCWDVILGINLFSDTNVLRDFGTKYTRARGSSIRLRYLEVTICLFWMLSVHWCMLFRCWIWVLTTRGLLLCRFRAIVSVAVKVVQICVLSNSVAHGDWFLYGGIALYRHIDYTADCCLLLGSFGRAPVQTSWNRCNAHQLLFLLISAHHREARICMIFCFCICCIMTFHACLLRHPDNIYCSSGINIGTVTYVSIPQLLIPTWVGLFEL